MKLAFKDPEEVLAGLRWGEENLPLEELPDKVRMLRTRDLRPILEMRQAALFCQGLSVALRTKVTFAMHEEADFDLWTSFERDGQRFFAAVQLKELVPEDINQETSFQAELDKLKKYADSKNLIVAFHLNRRCTLNLSALSPPKDVVAEIWVVAATNEEMTEWILVGNILATDCCTYHFQYPESTYPKNLSHLVPVKC